ncbi:hypothetical protein DPMN_108523 [Dreissena polymorpha]|uniref:WAP domain-containing protein n=1 Tax=Dreissena polymorpha TaxID=45954 RepID=A0A9D4K8X2_DREPO|nr:hypothetical protein DPMN_108523 [Dreissena polymorpha]
MDTVHYFAFICCAIGIVSADEKQKSVLPVHCALVRRAASQCDDPFNPPRKCCPVCEDKQKQGQCPVAPDGIITTCLVECQGDSSCTGDKKCCSFGCHVSCSNPVAESKSCE